MEKKQEHGIQKENSTLEISSELGTGVQVQLQGKITPNNLQSENPGMFPKPTADPQDPLNWPNLRKHTILGIVMLK